MENQPDLSNEHGFSNEQETDGGWEIRFFTARILFGGNRRCQRPAQMTVPASMIACLGMITMPSRI